VRGEPRDRVGDRGVELGGRAVEPHHHLGPPTHGVTPCGPGSTTDYVISMHVRHIFV
jgi:hypothetical protein